MRHYMQMFYREQKSTKLCIGKRHLPSHPHRSPTMPPPLQKPPHCLTLSQKSPTITEAPPASQKSPQFAHPQEVPHIASHSHTPSSDSSLDTGLELSREPGVVSPETGSSSSVYSLRMSAGTHPSLPSQFTYHTSVCM